MSRDMSPLVEERGSATSTVTVPAHDLSWQERAACSGRDTAWWFADRGEQHLVAAAKAVCAQCSVAVDCLAYAVAEQMDGIWGGTTARERRRGRPTNRLPGRVRRDIRRMAADPNMSTAEVAAEFEVSARTVLRIVNEEGAS